MLKPSAQVEPALQRLAIPGRIRFSEWPLTSPRLAAYFRSKALL
jgi:hypothetical protein